MTPGLFFFRLIEHDDGSWTCRRGRQDFDRHPSQDEALAHILEVAGAHPPSRVYVHHRDGRVFTAASFD
jgi:hypothetical protein